MLLFLFCFFAPSLLLALLLYSFHILLAFLLFSFLNIFSVLPPSTLGDPDTVFDRSPPAGGDPEPFAVADENAAGNTTGKSLESNDS